ncbi:HAD family phosphatase [Rubellicoccus peritrichatus]|uniref:HAD family phosphatase n=1 Tax=Rubellicoccus peritrichatus TaxID=3080537 RepID=A0AAQ3L979_9BACT|nr:HAD family phosphatase [Puniceicoccus sp. CR14]WOO41954.1 HAD family phosphatase [Puniceicoccus sp. CR14]
MNIGAIFDWDGVVIDSSTAHEQSWERLSEEENLPLFEGHFKAGFGRKNAIIIPTILKWTEEPTEIKRLSNRKEALYREIIKEDGIDALPGIHDLLTFLNQKGIPCVVGTSTDRINVETIMDALGVRVFFQDIVSSEDVSHGKPDPEVFLKAAGKIDRAPERCLVFEDAHYGIEAGLRGGMKVVGVATTHPIEDLHQADMAVHRLNELDFEKMLEMFNAS